MSESNTPAPSHGATGLATSSSTPAFTALGLIAPLLRAVEESGYTTPTPIQTQAIPAVLAGRDVLAGAQTGTGKTAAFVLPILQLLAANPRNPAPRRPRVLVLSPTRELSAQIEESVRTYGKHMRLSSVLVYGGVGMQPQVDALARGCDILVATPGRLLDHAGEKTVDLSTVEILVLDEADRMLDMGFIRDIRRVLALLPRKRQNLLFSATFSDEIRQLASGLLHQPAEVEVARRNAEAESVSQCCYLLPKERKRDLLVHLVKTGDWRQVLVFTKTKHGANRLAEQLRKAGIEADAIHGNKSQGARTRALGGFKSGEVRVLVATDIAARGLDIEGLPHVVNFDLPNVSEDYVHRIGRTGRAGMVGDAVALVSPEDDSLLTAIERLMKKKVRREPLPDFAAAPQAERDPRGDVPSTREPAPRRNEARGQEQRRRDDRGRSGDRRAQPTTGQHRDGQARTAQPRQQRGDAQRSDAQRTDTRRNDGRGTSVRRDGSDGRGGRSDAQRRSATGGRRPQSDTAHRATPQPVASQARQDTNEEAGKPREKPRGAFASLLSAFLPTRS